MKTVIIMRGFPGATKSTWLSKNFKGIICSADDFRMIEGKYVFDERTKDAHAKCLRKFTQAIVIPHWYGDSMTPVESIAVDNTNVTRAEVAPYYRLAQAYGYEVRIVTLDAYSDDCILRNIHGVPEAVIRHMESRWEWMPDWKEEVIRVPCLTAQGA